jgi:hypothetical protein
VDKLSHLCIICAYTHIHSVQKEEGKETKESERSVTSLKKPSVALPHAHSTPASLRHSLPGVVQSFP